MNKKIFLVLALATLFVRINSLGCTDGSTLSDAGCDSCATNAACDSCSAGYSLASGACTQCSAGTYATAGSTTCTNCPAGTSSSTLGATSSAACTTCAAGTYATAGSSSCTSCAAGTSSSATGATSSAACTTCAAGKWSAAGSATCTDCAAGTSQPTAGAGTSIASCVSCSANTYSAAASATCSSCATGTFSAAGASSCTNCFSGCSVCTSTTACTTCTTGYTATGTSPSITACTAPTPVPSTSSPSSAFNVTPALVYTTTDTIAPAFTAVDGSVMFGPGADSTSAYVWLLVNPSTAGGAYTLNRRTVNTTNFSKSNTTADVAITLGTVTGSAYVGPGYWWQVTSNCASPSACNWAGIGGTAVTQEISLVYVAGNGSSATTKALTGNTNANVFFNVKSSWMNNGIIFVAYVMSTKTVGTASPSAADTWAANGLYIQGVNVTSGALFYNTTGGVKAIAMTQSQTGATTCVATTGTGCASNYYDSSTAGNALYSFKVYSMNWTTTYDTVQYIWEDRTSLTGYVIKTGTINCTSGAATSGTTLTTSAAPVVTGTSSPITTVTTSYSPAGAIASFGTYGVFVVKTVTTAVDSPASSTTVYTIQGYLNGSATANTNFTVASGYMPQSIIGYHTDDGFVLLEQQYSTASTTPAQATLLQAERFFTNGSAYGAVVALGTYQDAPQTYQDTNGSVIVGYEIYDTNNGDTYSGYLGKYLNQQLAASTLTSIFAILSLLIVALFAF